ncbi:MAG: NADH-quinone oxidoreductase subunit L [Candidatus Sericytochromatia bacterium]|nr:NADH-quinone oxidoreductase subunit L [Candidatus Tanganyikabacteria bacterium]
MVSDQLFLFGLQVQSLVWLIPLLALLASAACGALWLGGERREEVFNAIALGSMTLVLVASGALFGFVMGGSHVIPRMDLPFLQIGDKTLALTVAADTLSVLMLVVVALVSFLVQLYSTSYLHDDEGYGRYFSFINLFSFAMLALVVVDDLLAVYMCWELVGLGSYLLIGHWYKKPEAAQAAKKAFVITRIGDFGFLLGILMLFGMFGTLELDALAEKVTHLEGVKAAFGLAPEAGLLVAAVLLFWGPIGKSAQFPLHVWLPDAMEGPTPVSALIHAATMVAAGVYLTARTMFLFAAAPHGALQFVGWIGAITALLAGSLALAQWDIKRILAYSTVSQLGYMMLALGFGPIGVAASIFHLFNHAFFKALLFLGSGSVIHATHSQDIREMGGLRKYMPWTFWPFTIATLSIAGVPLLSGFWSKDAILYLAWEHDKALWAVGTLVAGLTAFYMARLWFYTFAGTYRGEAEGRAHPHESPWPMTFPLAVLAVPSVLSGYWGTPWADGFKDFLMGGLAHSQHFAIGAGHGVAHGATHGAGGTPALPGFLGLPGAEWLVMGVSTMVALGGLAAAWACYGRQAATEPLERLGAVWTFLARKAYFDELYAAIRDRVVWAFAGFCSGFDKYVVDGLVNLVALGNIGAGEGLRQSETGKAQTYLWTLVAGTTVFAVVMVVFQNSIWAWAGAVVALLVMLVFGLYDRLAKA